MAAAAGYKTRSGSVLFTVQKRVFKERDIVDLSRQVQVPSTCYVIERFYTIKKEIGAKPGCHEAALREMSLDLQEVWIFLNLQPKAYSQILRQIKKLIESFEKIKRYPISKQNTATFKKAVDDLFHVMENGFDIKTFDDGRMDELEKKYWVKVVENSEEDRLYKDNCVPLLEDRLPFLKGRCTRLMWSTTEVDEVWLSEANSRFVDYTKINLLSL